MFNLQVINKILGLFACSIAVSACTSGKPKPASSRHQPAPYQQGLTIEHPAEGVEIIGSMVLRGGCSNSKEAATVAVTVDGYGSSKVPCEKESWSIGFSELDGVSLIPAEKSFQVTVNQDGQSSVARGFVTSPDSLPDEKFKSCLAMMTANPLRQSTEYDIFVGEGDDEQRVRVYCDFDTAGGGWTGITADVAYGKLGGKSNGAKLNKGDSAEIEMSGESEDGIYCSKETKKEGGHTAQYIFNAPFSYREFYINKSFEVRPNTSQKSADNKIQEGRFQVSWKSAQIEGTGDISFGSPEKSKDKSGVETDMIVTSYARHLSASCKKSKECESVPWENSPEVSGETTKDIFGFVENWPNASAQTQFSIGWGAAGDAKEGWCVWHTKDEKEGERVEPESKAMIFFRE